MSDGKEIQDRLVTLEGRIKQLIALHESLKSSCQDLLSENRRLVLELEDEKMKSKRLDEGYRNLKDQEIVATRHQVDRINLRINELISEIDKNIQLVES
ncbi:MAG: hypothetical protein ACKO7B_10540 [Flavobacteriales bacterium]